MINIILKRISLTFTSAPWSTKSLTISIDLSLIARVRGYSLIENSFHLITIDIRTMRIPYDND